jgi:hypothetical protein
MSQRHSFNKNYLQDEFDKLDAALKESFTCYLIGGGAMSFYGAKETTKDIDIILMGQDSLDPLKAALETLGYKEPKPLVITRPYNEMQTSLILENNDGFRWDVFLIKVYGKLTLSTGMLHRATSLYHGRTLQIYTASKEDLFLFKSVTNRDDDLDDTAKLAQSGLNWSIISQECALQSEISGRSWEGALYQTLQDLKEKYRVVAPIEKTLRIAAQQKLMEKELLEQIERGNNTIDSIAKELKMERRYVSRELSRLVNKGVISIDKTGRHYIFTLCK